MSKRTKTFRIARSRTGLGLFATQAIRKGRTIVEYNGRRIPTAQAGPLESERRNSYLFEINKQWTIDGSSRKNLARYVNHSCKPNAEAVLRRATRRLEYVAARRIEPGEEITVDYGEDYYRIFLAERGCRCAACAARKRSKRRTGKK